MTLFNITGDILVRRGDNLKGFKEANVTSKENRQTSTQRAY